MCDHRPMDFLGLFEQRLRTNGLDLVFPRGLAKLRSEFDVLRLSVLLRNNPLGVLIGNTRAMWPKFVHAVQSNTDLRSATHPLDRWVELCVARALADSTVAATAYFAHQPLATGYLPLQRWAQILGGLALSYMLARARLTAMA